jgi:phage tail sheath protein FI
MPVTPTYPGVYVQEEASGARAIAGVATSVTAFVAMAERGPMKTPQLIFNFADFERNFGSVTEGELATQVRNFYLNGGGKAYVMRIAQNPGTADVVLRDQLDGADALAVTARDPGLEGNSLRVEVDYDTGTPEETFNLNVYRSELKSDGTIDRKNEETFTNLSMDPSSGFFADKVVNNSSALVTVKATPPGTTNGVSIAGLVLRSAQTDVRDDLLPLVTATANALRIQIGNNPPVSVALTPVADIASNTTLTNITSRWKQDIDTALSGASLAVSVTVTISGSTVPNDGTGANRLLRVESGDGTVRITPGLSNDCTVGLMLGTGQGGIEGSDFGDARPAPSGFVARMGRRADLFQNFRRFAGTVRTELATIDLTDDVTSPAIAQIPVALTGAGPMFEVGTATNLGNALAVLDTIAGLVTNNSQNRWTAKRHGLRLAMSPRYGDEDTGQNTAITSGPGPNLDLDDYFNGFENTAVYKLGTIGGTPGPSAFQGAANAGSNGNPATSTEYDDAYKILDREVDLFNILVLPRNKGQDNDSRGKLWGPASAFCEKKRAFLLVDPKDDWNDITKAEKGVDGIRTGVATRNSACYWPRLDMGDKTYVDPSGAMAGVMARIDGNRGVWKAPAGLEATIRGVRGVEHQMTDPENGVINPKALNAIRLFPAGVVGWGARTLVGYNGSGNVDDKYVPVRRTMLYIEESLYRGLRFAVFEPNAEPLWAQIRLAAGSFMNGLFRQGAFKGEKASDAYFVICDSTTTTPNDINLGIVNVIVGFAPLKPAEFVILTVKQIAGQTQV